MSDELIIKTNANLMVIIFKIDNINSIGRIIIIINIDRLTNQN